MKRWIALGLLAAAVAASFAPLLDCPDCLGVARGGFFAPGCPRCGDGGRVSGFNRVSRRDLDPDLALLVGRPWQQLVGEGNEFPRALDRLLQRAGRPAELPGEWIGTAVFVDVGDERLVTVLVRPSFLLGESSEAGALLFAGDGSLRDLVRVSTRGGVFDLKAEHGKGGEVAVSCVTPLMPSTILLRRGTETRPVAADALRLRPRAGGFEVVVDR